MQNSNLHGQKGAASSRRLAAAWRNVHAYASFLYVEKTFGNWRDVQKTHFNDGGIFDQVYTAQ